MKLSSFLAAATGAAVFCAGAAHAQVTTTNLLTNPGAEAGNITGWTAAMDATGSVLPGVDNGTFDTGINPHTGTWDFCAYTNASSTLTQNVTLVGTQGITAAMIDAGTLQANVSFWEQGLDQGTPSDEAGITVNFLNGVGTQIGTDFTGYIDSHNNTWTQGTDSYVIPTGTRTIQYEMTFLRNVGSDNDSFIDDNSLAVAGITGSAATPEPSALALLGAPAIAGAVRLWRRRRA